MEEVTLYWIQFSLLTVFFYESSLHVDAYPSETKCVRNICASYVTRESNYQNARFTCQNEFGGYVARLDQSEQWIIDWLHRQMNNNRNNEVWVGAELVKPEGDEKCQAIQETFSDTVNLRLTREHCRKKKGVLCMKDMQGDCSPGYMQCSTKCVKYYSKIYSQDGYTWQAARQKCKEVGEEIYDHLLVPDQNNNQCNLQLTFGGDVWVKGNGEEIKWSDGVMFNPATQRTDWKDSEPAKQKAHQRQCISYCKGDGWKTQECVERLPFACVYHNSNGPKPNGMNPTPAGDDITTAAPDVIKTPESDNGGGGDDNMALMLGIISLSVVVIVSIVVVVIIVVLLKRRKAKANRGNLEKSGSLGSVQSNTSSTRYLVEPTAPGGPKPKPAHVEKKKSTGSNYYEYIDAAKMNSPGYQDLKGGHYQYDHPYAGLDFTKEQNRRNEQKAPPDSPPAYDEPYADKRRLRPRPEEQMGKDSKRSPPPSPVLRHVTFGGIETPLAKVMSNSPKAKRTHSPKTPPKPLPKIPRPSVTVRPPADVPKAPKPNDQPNVDSYNQSAHSYLEPTGQDNTAHYNQSMHSYLELLPDATPEELEAVHSSKAAAVRGDKAPSTKPGSGNESPKGTNVREKAKALEGKFKLSTSPTLGRQKLTDGKYASVVDGDLYTNNK